MSKWLMQKKKRWKELLPEVRLMLRDRVHRSDHSTDEESTEKEDESDIEAPDWGPDKKKAKNSGLAVGHKGIAVVLRGDQLGIFKETTDGRLELGGTVNDIKGPGRGGKSFKPKKVSGYLLA
jgi:VID27 C-terminal WD40-like domain